MAPQLITEYERKRLENIKRNQEMMVKLNLQSTAFHFSSGLKRHRDDLSKTIKKNKPKSESETPVVIRRSLRARGPKIKQPQVDSVRRGDRVKIKPHYSSQMTSEDDGDDEEEETPESPTEPDTPIAKMGPITMQEACIGDPSDQSLLISTVKIMSVDDSVVTGSEQSFDPKSLVLKPENVSQFVPGKVLNLKFFPWANRTMLVAGNQYGEIGFWDVDCKDKDHEGVYIYKPHTAAISGISIQPFASSKVFSSCYDGFIRLMDVGSESFELVYSTYEIIYSLSQDPLDRESLYFAEGRGFLNVCDTRVGKSSNSWLLHDERINSIDFNPEKTNLIATSSTDGTACIWDLRMMNEDEPKYLKMINYEKPVHSAYFSPSGRFLAATSIDDKVGILGGDDFTDKSTVYHLNRNSAGTSDFRAVWGWDDSYLFIGNLSRGLDVISKISKKTVTSRSPLISAIPYRFAVHPYKVGIVAGGSSTGQTFLWTN